ALWPIGNPNFHFWQLITHMFAHADSGSYLFVHILFNMFTLWMFGRILEDMWGTKPFLKFYLLCGLGAASLHLMVQYFVYGAGGGEAALGASGAVFGVLVAFAMLFPNTELYLMFIPVPIKAKWVVLGLIVLDLFGGFSNSSDGVAHFAHLGGAITGFILIKIRNKTNRKTLF
ncbi:MAG TPA: rhomboid family intramembrane serine protease, partial [Niabella sp.]|nr:rhomboid family intramembrane serine protease [Niabella sp.]